jgi:hypothetical protein
MAVELVEAVASRNAPQHRIAGPQALHEQVEQRGADSDDHAVQDAKQDEARNADQGEEELDPADPPQFAQRVEIDETDGGRRQDGAQRRRGEESQASEEKQDRHRQSCCRNDAGQLRLAAHQIIDGGAGIRGRHGEPPNNPDATFRGSKSHKLAIGVDGILVLRAEAARGHDARPKLTISIAAAPGIKSLNETPCGMGSMGAGSPDGIAPTTRIPRP